MADLDSRQPVGGQIDESADRVDDRVGPNGAARVNLRLAQQGDFVLGITVGCRRDILASGGAL